MHQLTQAWTDELRGRVMAAYSFVVVGLSQVVGSATSGTIANAFGTAWTIRGAALIMLGYACYVFRPGQRFMVCNNVH